MRSSELIVKINVTKTLPLLSENKTNKPQTGGEQCVVATTEKAQRPKTPSNKLLKHQQKRKERRHKVVQEVKFSETKSVNNELVNEKQFDLADSNVNTLEADFIKWKLYSIFIFEG